MKIPKEQLCPFTSPLVSFTGDKIYPKGIVTLTIITRTYIAQISWDIEKILTTTWQETLDWKKLPHPWNAKPFTTSGSLLHSLQPCLLLLYFAFPLHTLLIKSCFDTTYSLILFSYLRLNLVFCEFTIWIKTFSPLVMHLVDGIEQPKLPMSGRSKQKSPISGRRTKVAYGWIV